MNNTKYLLSIIVVGLLLTTSLGSAGSQLLTDKIHRSEQILGSLEDFDDDISVYSSDLPSGIVVSDKDPFYPLVATPLAVHYNSNGDQTLIPLYIKNFDNPSSSVTRAISQINISVDYEINGLVPVKEVSLSIAETFWEYSMFALVIKNDTMGYDLGVMATPLASYLGIPVIVTDVIDEDVVNVLGSLGVEFLFICGDLTTNDFDWYQFEDVDDIIEGTLYFRNIIFEQPVDYITLTNPQDISEPTVIIKEVFSYSDTVSSSVVLPTQSLNVLLKGKSVGQHNFTIPADYKYSRVKIDLENRNADEVGLLGDQMYVILSNSKGYRYIYGTTGGGLPVRNTTGAIVKDRLHYEMTIYNETGKFDLMILGHWFASKEGSYNLTITLEKLDTTVVPLMKNLSSLAPYLTAYHKGIIYGKPEFAFAANDNVIENGTPCPGVSQPGTNPRLIKPSNNHTLEIHDQLNELLLNVLGYQDVYIDNLKELRDYFATHPLYIAIMADPTMIPMYFYYNPDGRPDADAYLMGFAVPSDYIYGDIDPKPNDVENDSYTYWPFMENIVGRVTGKDVQDCSALIARTIYYNKIINTMGTWKNNALVQTGCGLEFQNLPVITKIGKLLNPGARDEPTKFPTGESTFINKRLQSDMQKGNYTVKSTQWTQSQLEGFSQEGLDAMKNAGILNRLLFPKNVIGKVSGTQLVTGGQDQLNSSLIFSFAHGIYFLFEFGDVLMGSRGFPFVTALSRIKPSLSSRLSDKGNFEIRSVENMKYGPSVIYVESCITARTDGMNPENTLSQTYIHAGVNTYIGATRVTADPGYLEPRPLPGGVGVGVLGYLKASLNLKLKGEYPELHFGAVIAEDFILNLNNDSTTGLALRNAKNSFLPKDANSTFLWTPPLTFSSGNSIIDNEVFSSLHSSQADDGRTRVLDKKYVALHEFVLYGDPAFNPYQPKNNG